MAIEFLPKRLFARMVEHERRRLFGHFFSMVDIDDHTTLLEIGGPTEGFSEVASRFQKVVVVNQSPRDWQYDGSVNSYLVRADARRLPFPDGAFDYVFSNATVEHIPRKDWSIVAAEIRRVAAKGIFVSTPNFWFPFEPHYLLPGFQWLPEAAKRFLLFPLGLHLGWMSKENYEVITLPRRRQLARAFGMPVHGWGAIIPRHWVVWSTRGPRERIPLRK